jgi:nucleotide sugar dehydrogenase
MNSNSSHQEAPTVTQIGLGVVGYPYAEAYLSVGCKVYGIEANKVLVDKYKEKFPTFHITDDISSIKDVDFIMISINTPLKGKALDLSYLFSSIPNVKTIIENSSKDCLVIIRSTVRPTTCMEYKKQLEAVCTKKVNVLFQPEFLRAATATEDALNPWHIVIGAEPGTDVTRLINLYKKFVNGDEKKITTCTIAEAELMKIFHNCFNATKISYFNQCALLCESISKTHGVDIDIQKITGMLVHTCEGLRNPKYGTKPGHAYYGTCLPKDSAELADLERQYKLEVPLFEQVVGVNNVVKSRDKEEVLVGDHHMAYNKF